MHEARLHVLGPGGGLMNTQEILSANERSDAAPQPTYEGGRLRLSGQKQADE